jgi:hypothetical protein
LGTVDLHTGDGFAIESDEEIGESFFGSIGVFADRHAAKLVADDQISDTVAAVFPGAYTTRDLGMDIEVRDAGALGDPPL